MTVPYWLDGAPPLAPRLTEDISADVVVIGAGLCGASAALALGRAGVSTVWVDSAAVAHGASGRNAGFLLQGTAERYVRAVAIHGRDRARRVHALSRENHRAMAAEIERLGLECGYMRRGSLQLAGSVEEEGDLLESATLLREDGFPVEQRDADALGPALTGAGFRLGVHLPDDGELQPAAFVQGIARAAMGLGVQLFEHTPVTTLHADAPGDVRAETPRGTIRAQIALVCTNAAAGHLLGGLAGTIDPVRGQMLATAPAPPLFACPIYADHGYDYWRQDEHGRIALGGWRNLDPEGEVGVEEALHPLIQARMTEFLHRFAALRDVPITHRWSGTMGFSRDGLPMVGAVPGSPGALVAAGFTGHGFGFAWVCGRAIAEMVLDGRSEVAELFPARRFRG
ncbi:MAG: FAD-binding oxidoreductase [Pseudomonadota bacterium]|nr:FAD-binding oxidoreductase [Pseudomonadota bacterium]